MNAAAGKAMGDALGNLRYWVAHQRDAVTALLAERDAGDDPTLHADLIADCEMWIAAGESLLADHDDAGGDR